MSDSSSSVRRIPSTGLVPLLPSESSKSRSSASQSVVPGGGSMPAGTILDHRYRIEAPCGRGAFGQVYRCLVLESQHQVAIKNLPLTQSSQGSSQQSHSSSHTSLQQERKRLLAEFEILQCLDHPHIVACLDAFESGGHYHIVLEFCDGGSLQSLLKRVGKLPEAVALPFVAQMVSGLIYLHEQGILHRDIKAANILATLEGVVKLADFGVAMRVPLAAVGRRGEDDDAMQESCAAGSPYWMAPEVINMHGVYAASDVWSLACTILELIQGHPPYHHLAPMQALFRIAQDEAMPLPDSLSPALRDCLLRCLQRDVQVRLSAQRLAKSAWLSQAMQQLESDLAMQLSIPSIAIPLQKVEKLVKLHLEQGAAAAADWKSASVNKPAKESTLISIPPVAPVVVHKPIAADLVEEDDDGQWDSDFSGTLDVVPKLSLSTQQQQQQNSLTSNESSFADEWDVERTVRYSESPFHDKRNSQPQRHLQREQDYIENENTEDYNDMFGDVDTSLTMILPVRRQVTEEEDLEQLFAEMEMKDHENPWQREIRHEKVGQVKQLLEKLELEKEELQQREILQQLTFLFSESEVAQLTAQQLGVMKMMDIVDLNYEWNVLPDLLVMLNQFIEGSDTLGESLCLLGALPPLFVYANVKYPARVRLEIGKMIYQLLSAASPHTLQMCISCGAVPVMVHMLSDSSTTTNTEQDRSLTYLALQCIAKVFSMQGNTPRSDFCRLFTKHGLVPRLALALRHVNRDNSNSHQRSLQENYIKEICDLFMKLACTDDNVRSQMAQSRVLFLILDELDKVSWESRISLLKCLRFLSFNMEGQVQLSEMRCVERLVPYLRRGQGPMLKESHLHVLQTLLNLCSVNAFAQRQLVESGALQDLRELIECQPSLKDFAFMIMNQLSRNGECLPYLMECGGAAYFMSLLAAQEQWLPMVVDMLRHLMVKYRGEVLSVLSLAENVHALAKSLDLQSVGGVLVFEFLNEVARISSTFVHRFAIEPHLQLLAKRLLSHVLVEARLPLLNLLQLIAEHVPLSLDVWQRTGIIEALNAVRSTSNVLEKKVKSVLENIQKV